MRSFVSFLTGLLAVALLVLLLPLAWVATHVASEDGYVDFSASLIQDRQFRDDLSAAAVEALIERTGLPTATLDSAGQRLRAVSDDLVETKGFIDTWEQAQRQSHRALFADPRDLPAELDATNRLVVDVAPIAQAVVDGATDRLGVSVEVPDQMLVTVGGSDQRDLIDRIRDTPEQAMIVGALAVGSALISVLAARRRGRAIAWLGLGAVAAALAVRLLTHEVVPDVLGRNSPPRSLGYTMQELLTERAVSSLDQWGLTVMIAGGIVAIGSMLILGRGRPEQR